MNQKSDDFAARADPSEARAPDRTAGFTVMLVVIIFVALWMSRQDSGVGSGLSIQATAPITELDGFRSDAWFLPDDSSLGFIEISAGTFTMGSNPSLDSMAFENERWSALRRQGIVELPRYYISRYETTVAQFQAYLADTGAQSISQGLIAPGNFPITHITWPEALGYARWLDRQLRESDRTPVGIKTFLDSGARVTLPTEAEWEKAARGSDSRIWPWGSQPGSGFANFNGSGLRKVGAVACPGCSYGLSDMAGNVWELTRSPLEDYPYDPGDDLANLDRDALWVMRGGGYGDPLANVRAAIRGGVDPGVRNATIGFRLVISKL